MGIVAPAFITNHEIDALLGGGAGGKRHRQRLQKRGLLPEPRWLERVDRFRVGVYPAFALAGLVDAIALTPDAQRGLRALATQALSSAAFRDLAQALELATRDVVGRHGDADWEFDAVVRRLGELAAPAVVEWDTVEQDAAQGLAQWGIQVSSELGSVERRTAGVYVVMLDGRRVERFAAACVAPRLRKGSPVVVEHVSVMGRGLDYVMPALETDAAGAADVELDWSGVTEKAWDQMLSTAQHAAESFSFDADYWRDDAASDATTAYPMPAGLLSGREAAARLIVPRARS